MNIKVGKYFLDEAQSEIVKCNNKYILVTAGAGSGKTLTILGKIFYLINEVHVDAREILCISFTKASSLSLKNKIKENFNLDMDVFTFHKLSLNILSKNKEHYEITQSDTLENIIHEYFSHVILNDEFYMKLFLKYVNIKKKKNIKDAYLKFYETHYKDMTLIENLFSTFIRLFKCRNSSLEDFIVFLKKARITLSYSKYKKEKIFLIFALNFYLMYERHLDENNEIDFDDMISLATDSIKNKNVKLQYKYIIIDEYQDTSLVRFELIKEILKNTNANLMVVGDDFQSIYKFTGCDISLFLDFKTYFEDATIMKIENTYRNSQELINVAGDFVMKNKRQIKKNLKSGKSLKEPIRIIRYTNMEDAFTKLVLKIYETTRSPIMVLGRNNKDIYKITGKNFKVKDNNIIYIKNPSIPIYFLTAHKSKGLEEENVIIINLCDDKLGFPNKIEDDKIHRFVSNKSDNYPFSEERRLFYVAITRTKNYVYLLIPKDRPSLFASEIMRSYKKYISEIKL